MRQYAFTVPECKTVRYIIHTDCKNEADDQYTLAHILMTPKLKVAGIVAGHFDKLNFQGIPAGETAKASLTEVEKVMELMNLGGKYPVVLGAPTFLKDEDTPIDSEGARFIIAEAMKDDPRPMFIGLQGNLTDLASAILLKPEICERMTAIWIGGGDYPEGGFEFNLAQDVCAANVVFRSSMPLWQIPVGTYSRFAVTLAELQHKVKPHGKIGAYLFEQLAALNEAAGAHEGPWPHGETWFMGDEGTVAVLMDSTREGRDYTMIPAPTVEPETLRYLPSHNRAIRVYHHLDVRMDLEDFFCKLALLFPGEED